MRRVAALEAGGFFDAFPIPPEAYQFDVVFDLQRSSDSKARR